MERSGFPFSCQGYVQSLAFNSSGTRLAAASADQKIYMWSYENGWRESGNWNAHHGAVYKVRWAPEEFGPLIASCSFDKTIRIWEEKKERAEDALWKNLATLVESKEPVVDIRFAPKSYGLVLAACSLNGEVRVYDATDLLNLALWTCSHTFEASALGSNCLAWNPSSEGQMVLIGNNDLAAARQKLSISRAETPELLQLWVFSPDSKRWTKAGLPQVHEATVLEVEWAPRLGRKIHCIASLSSDGKVAIWRLGLAGNVLGSVVVEMDVFEPGRLYSMAWDVLGNGLVAIAEPGNPVVWVRDGVKTWKKR